MSVPVPAKLVRARSALQKTSLTSDDDSIDELAGDALLFDPAQQPMRSSFQSDVSMPEPLRPRSSKVIETTVDKPLPPLPTNGTY